MRAPPLADALDHNTALEHLDLRTNAIGAEGAAKLQAAFRGHWNLATMRLDGDVLKDEL